MKKVLVITVLLAIAMMLQAQNPPRNLEAVAGDEMVTLNWDSPIENGMIEITYHDGNPYDAYYQNFGFGYGTVFDLSDFDNPTLQKLDFRHTSYDIMGPHEYNLHIIDWDDMSVITVIEGLETTVNDDWETDINLQEISAPSMVGIFIEPLGNSASDAYPVVDMDPLCNYLSYVVDVDNNYSISEDPADGDFLIDLWISADGYRSAKAKKVPMVEHPVSLHKHALRPANPQFSTPQSHNREDVLGYLVYRNNNVITPNVIQTLTYIDTNVTNGVEYTYYVTAMYESGQSEGSNSVTVVPNIPQGIYLTEGFESNYIPSDWIIIDADGDSYNWVMNESSFEPNSGSRCVCSASYINNVGPLTPDNWLITRAIDLETDAILKFWVAPQDEQWINEHYKVKLSTTGTDIDDFDVLLMEETIASSAWSQKTVDLSEYTGETVYIAFEHCEVTDMFFIKLDDILVYDPTENDNDAITMPEFSTSCYPNPFNPETTISYSLPIDAQVKLEVFNIRGQKVTTLVNDRVDAGQHSVVWNGTDQSGSPVSSGVYFYKLNTSGNTLIRKIALMK